MDVLHGLDGLTERETKIHPVGEAQGHDVGIIFAEFQGRSILWQSGDIHLKEIYCELTIDVMQLIFVLSVFLSKVCLVDFLKVVKVIRTLGIDTLVNDEVLAVLLMEQGVAAIRAAKVQGRETITFFR
jgi:hypothetical protein